MLDVDVAGLNAAGAEVRAAGADLGAATAAADGRLAPAGHSGSAAATAARAAATGWMSELRRLTTDLNDFGATLTAAARQITVTDRAGADDLRQVPR
ncbi:hypothetical protein [Actinoplanes italicus]|uniref:hypothetical protein n=1 Tax=Actinoplanes italicus TaxID=113567 RepID=UPI00147536F1|nr:hypothetical protein [Actinoplanes italicus]